jgi:hypothetical protein
VSEQSFSISIDDAHMDNLKEAILKKKSTMFANIEADPLVLWNWKVSVSSSSKPSNSLFLKRTISIGTARTLRSKVAEQEFLEDDALPEADPSYEFHPPVSACFLLHCPSNLPSLPILDLNCFV